MAYKRKLTEEDIEKLIHPDLGSLFSNDYVFGCVCSVLASERGQDFIAIENQMEVCREMIDQITSGGSGEPVTGKEAMARLNIYMSNACRWLKKQESPKYTKKKGFTKIWDRAVGTTVVLAGDISEVTRRMEEGEEPPFDKVDLLYYVQTNLRSLTNSIDALVIQSKKAYEIIDEQ